MVGYDVYSFDDQGSTVCDPSSPGMFCPGTNVFPGNIFAATRCVTSGVANAGLGGTSQTSDADAVPLGKVNFYQVGHHTPSAGHAAPLGIVPPSGLVPPGNVGQLVLSSGICP